MDSLYARLAETSTAAPVIISIALMLFLGFAMTRMTKILRLPNVTAYIVTGILIGPNCLKLVPQGIVDGMGFLSDIALAFIAFGVGEFFRLDALKKNGGKAVLITLMEALLVSVLIFVACYGVLHLNLAFSIVLAALATATAPASTMMTIRQTHSKGEFVDTLLLVIAMDNVVSLIAYSVAISIALASMGKAQQGGFATYVLPILSNLLVLVLGGGFGWLLKLLFRERSADNRLIVSIAMLFALCGICTVLDVSPLLGCMSMGTVYINLTDDRNLFQQLNYFSPPILLLFFVRSGLNFRLDALVSATGTGSVGAVPLLLVGIVYFVVRIAGKYGGAFLGSVLTRKPPKVRNYLGMALIPQAGVAIGLASLGARTLGGQVGTDLETIILASSVLYELVGPACAKLSLYLSGSYSDKIEDLVPAEALPEGKGKTEVELLIERIHAIQEKLPAHPEISEEEAAFNAAAEEQHEISGFRPGRMLTRR